MSDVMVSAGEAARRLGVAPATIQRWVDGGLLNAERTPGGHRRIYVTELRRLIAANRPARLSAPVADWFDVLMTGDHLKVKTALERSRRETGNWAVTADEVAAAIAEIGRSWEAGACQIFEEHAATEALRRAAAACVAEMPIAHDAPRAALFTIENERHTLGLSLSELVVGEAGWRPIWIGEGPPTAELASLAEKFKPRLFLVAASSASPPASVARYQSALMLAALDAGVRLVLAGSGRWKEAPGASRVLAFTDLPQALVR